MRINKYLALCGVASRRNAEEYILKGKVKVNDKVVTNLATNIEDTDQVEVNGKIVTLAKEYVYYMMNKPKGYLCTVKDDRDRKTVLNLVQTDYRIFPVGRLDYDSEGLLLLTNDGDLTNKLTHPSNNIGKTYIVKIEGDLSLEETKKIEKGIVLNGEKLRKCKLAKVTKDANMTRFEITIYQGKNREIRRMFEAIGKKVVFLKRIKIGELSLGGLDRGCYRELTKQELNYLKSI